MSTPEKNAAPVAVTSWAKPGHPGCEVCAGRGHFFEWEALAAGCAPCPICFGPEPYAKAMGVQLWLAMAIDPVGHMRRERGLDDSSKHQRPGLIERIWAAQREKYGRVSYDFRADPLPVDLPGYPGVGSAPKAGKEGG